MHIARRYTSYSKNKKQMSAQKAPFYPSENGQSSLGPFQQDTSPRWHSRVEKNRGIFHAPYVVSLGPRYYILNYYIAEL